MKVLYISQHFSSKEGHTRPYELAKKLTEEKIDVVMLTGQKANKEPLAGIKVLSTETNYNHTFSFYRRIFAFFLFFVKSLYLGVREKEIDLIYASSSPLSVGLSGAILSKLKKVPFVFEVRDVWPDTAIEMNIIRNKLIIWILHKIEKWIYKQATHIVALSEGIRSNIQSKNVSEKKIIVLTNLAHCDQADEFDVEKERLQINQRYPELQHKTIALYPGTFGLANDLMFILDIAKKYPDPTIHYILIGHGKEKAAIQARIEQESLTNVWVLDSLSKKDIFSFTAASDVGIVNLADVEILAKENSSNKFFDFLAFGKPIILNFKGWQHDILTQYQAGSGFNYEDKEGYYLFLKSLQVDCKRRIKMGEQARELAESHFDAKKISEKFYQFILSIKENKTMESKDRRKK